MTLMGFVYFVNFTCHDMHCMVLKRLSTLPVSLIPTTSMSIKKQDDQSMIQQQGCNKWLAYTMKTSCIMLPLIVVSSMTTSGMLSIYTVQHFAVVVSLVVFLQFAILLALLLPFLLFLFCQHELKQVHRHLHLSIWNIMIESFKHTRTNTTIYRVRLYC